VVKQANLQWHIAAYIIKSRLTIISSPDEFLVTFKIQKFSGEGAHYQFDK